MKYKVCVDEVVNELIERLPNLIDIKPQIIDAVWLLIASYEKGNKLLVCGNGGSAADALHIVGELMKGFVLPRKLNYDLRNLLKGNSDNADFLIDNLQSALPTISLVSETSLSTAYANDNVADLVFAQQVLGYGKEQDIFLGISTSGDSKNVMYAAEVARALGLKVIGLTGKTGGNLRSKCDVCICVPETETYKIQELHLPIYHTICLAIEKYFYGEK